MRAKAARPMDGLRATVAWLGGAPQQRCCSPGVHGAAVAVRRLPPSPPPAPEVHPCEVVALQQRVAKGAQRGVNLRDLAARKEVVEEGVAQCLAVLLQRLGNGEADLQRVAAARQLHRLQVGLQGVAVAVAVVG